MTRRFLPIAAVLATGLLLASCAADSGSGGASASAEPTAITIALPAQPPGTDPILTRSISAWNIYYGIYDGLTRIDATGEVQPGLAEAWESNDDVSEWTFQIRPDVTFHDGTPLTAADIVFTYETILASDESTNKAAISMVDSVVATDDSTVVFTLKNPYAAFGSMAATIGIVPQAAYEAAAGQFAANPVGTGPYKYVSQSDGVDYVVEKNTDYWGAEPDIDSVTFAFVGAEDARVSGVESGTLDIAIIPPNQVEALAGSTTVETATAPGNQVVFLGANSAAGPLANTDLRNAISLAVDREAITNALLGGLAEPTGQILAEGVTGYVPGIDVPEQDVEEAAMLVASSGYAGEEITLEFASSGGLARGSEVAQAIEGYLSEIGLNITLVGVDQASFSLKLANHEITGLYLNGWAPSVMDGDVVINQLFAGGPEDYAKNADMAALYIEQQSAAGAAREAVYEEIDALNTELGLAIPLYTNNYSFAIGSGIDWAPAVDGIYRIADISLSE